MKFPFAYLALLGKLQDNPMFNSSFINRRSRYQHENCLAYALNHRLEGPSFAQLSKELTTNKSTALDYFTREINSHFKDPDLIKKAPFKSGELPPALHGYYITALLISAASASKKTTIDRKSSKFDFHFLVQNSDGYFSHRRGEAQAEQKDSAGNLIRIPEFAKFTYPDNKHESYDYEFIGYLYAKCNKDRLAHMQENKILHQKGLAVAREFPEWERKGDFSYDSHYTNINVNRKITFVNRSQTKMVSKIEFLGSKNHQLRVIIKFKNLDLCNDFLDTLPEKIVADVSTMEEKIIIDFSSQEQFDSVFKLFHKLYPLNQEMLTEIPNYLNTRIPQRVTETDWLQSYPAFNPDFSAKINKFAPENCLSYALNIKASGPSLCQLGSYKQSPDKQLEYVTTQLNNYFANTSLALIAPYESGQLPPWKPGYYIVSLHYSSELGIIQTNGHQYYQIDDFHFLVQNNDRSFSHRRGDANPPEQVDSEGDKIDLPETAKLFYVSKNVYHYSNDNDLPKKLPACMDYRFIGYIYLKTNEMRLNLPHKSLNLLDKIEAKAASELQNKVTQFKGSFFMYPPLPEFFNDARNKIEEFHHAITSKL